MAHYNCKTQREEKWYNKNIFPLVPFLEVKSRDGKKGSFFDGCS